MILLFKYLTKISVGILFVLLKNSRRSFKYDQNSVKKKKKELRKNQISGINPESVYSTLLNRLIVSSRFRYLHNWRRKFRILESYPYSRYNVIVRVLSSFHCWSIDISILFSPFTCSNFIQVKRRLLKEAVIIYTGVWNTLYRCELLLGIALVSWRHGISF